MEFESRERSPSTVSRGVILKLVEAVSSYVERSDLTVETAVKLRHRLNCWNRHSQQTTTEITPAEFDAFRVSAKAAGLAARTIEETVNDLALICGLKELGRRLKRWKTSATKFVPSLDLISAAYENADAAEWPNGHLTRSPALRVVSSAVWLRAFMVFAFHTGFRLRDLRTITWSSITPDLIDWQASKTSKRHRIPNCAIVERHLEPLRSAGSDRVFPISASQERLLRRELSRLAGDAAAFGPQPLRRAAVTQWAIGGGWSAGEMIQGSGLSGVMSRYVDGLAVLVAALPRRPWPSAMLTADERNARFSREHSLADLAQRLPLDRLDDLLKVGRAFAG
uniref:Integrase n=1 Tax=uncultured marine virus TaxID=186617 RepID=A0A0F7LAB3_9VIRU|nr:hypothetical protein [uncultured marine virus]